MPRLSRQHPPSFGRQPVVAPPLVVVGRGFRPALAHQALRLEPPNHRVQVSREQAQAPVAVLIYAAHESIAVHGSRGQGQQNM